MFVIIGVEEEHYPNGSSDRVTSEVVAKFSTKELARQYIEKAMLSTYKNPCGRDQHSRQFKKKSLLAWFCRAYVEVEEKVPVDPTL